MKCKIGRQNDGFSNGKNEQNGGILRSTYTCIGLPCMILLMMEKQYKISIEELLFSTRSNLNIEKIQYNVLYYNFHTATMEGGFEWLEQDQAGYPYTVSH